MAPSEITRQYQLELTELAIASNTIIVLDTGSGKTHIAACLLTHYENIELQRREDGQLPKKVSFFLVPTVTLVEQQCEYVSRTLRREPKAICGAMTDIDRWNREDWRSLLDEKTVIVCTGEILNQALAKQYVAVPEMNLLAFDEAHHAKAGHPYAAVMKRCRQSSSARPRIIGMTASPVESTDKIEEDLAKLQKTLEAKIATSLDGSLLQHVHRPREEEWEYINIQTNGPTELMQRLHQFVQMRALDKVRQSAKRTLVELGPWCADHVWLYAFESSQLIRIRRKIEGDDTECPRPRSQVHMELLQLDTAAAIVHAHVAEAAVDLQNALSFKVKVLHQKLQQEFSNNTLSRCIVFVRERTNARALCDVFKDIFPVHGMQPTYLVGIGSGDAGEATNSWNAQKATLKSFRNGTVNCIFATQVAEEGLDIPACNLVVRFNPYGDIIQYVQSRGRARFEKSVYAVMVDSSDKSVSSSCKYIRDCEEWLRQYYSTLAPDRLINLRETTLRMSLASKYGDQYFKTGTGARCDLDNALAFLEHYARSLQYENIAANRLRWIELLDRKFQYLVRIPIDASRATYPGLQFSSPEVFQRYLTELPSYGGAKIMEIVGLEIYHKGLAKRSAALTACRALRSMGLLDDNLDSIHKKKLEAMDHVRLPELEKALVFDVKVRADFWAEGAGAVPETLFATTFTFSGLQNLYSPIVLFTRQSLPTLQAFPLVLEDDVEMTVTVQQSVAPVSISAGDLDLLTTFTFDGVFTDVLKKRYTKDASKAQYWIAPGGRRPEGKSFGDIVDIHQLKALEKGYVAWSAENSNPMEWCDKFLVSGLRWSYISSTVVPGGAWDSAVPQHTNEIPNKNTESVFQFTASTGSTWKDVTYPVDTQQPVLEAVMTSFRRDFRLAATKAEKMKRSFPCEICPQPLKISPLLPSMARSCILFLSIWCQINDCLIAEEVTEKLQLPIPTNLAMEALTYVTEEEAKFMEYDDTLQDHPNQNYERLEFYGDTFLKLAIVLILFIKLDKETALNYHVKKKELISNHNLSNVVRHLGLDRYMRSGQVERRECWPLGVELISGKKPRNEAPDGTVKRMLHQKSIADVAEALIGASMVASYGQRDRFDMALQAVTKLVQSHYHDGVSSWSTYTRLYKPPEWQNVMDVLPVVVEEATAVSQVLGYDFQYPNIVRSALTHKSLTKTAVPNYERLEVLGDGLYDMCVADFLFHKYPNRGPQFLTEHKDVMVSNKFMAFLCVKLGLHRFIRHNGSADAISRCDSYVHQYYDAIEKADDIRDPNFWYELESEPKMFADVIESLVGAMFIDSKFDFHIVQKFFDDHVRHFFEDEKLHTEVMQAHPVTKLVHFLKSRFRCFGFHASTEVIPAVESKVKVADRFVKDKERNGEKILVSLLDDDLELRSYNGQQVQPVVQKTNSIQLPSATTAYVPMVRSTLTVHKITLATAEADSAKVAKARAARHGLSKLRAIAANGAGPREFVDTFGCGCKGHWASDAEADEDNLRGRGDDDLDY